MSLYDEFYNIEEKYCFKIFSLAEMTCHDYNTKIIRLGSSNEITGRCEHTNIVSKNGLFPDIIIGETPFQNYLFTVNKKQICISDYLPASADMNYANAIQFVSLFVSKNYESNGNYDIKGAVKDHPWLVRKWDGKENKISVELRKRSLVYYGA